jgi:GNAT superfamily N-acetyltransferase
VTPVIQAGPADLEELSHVIAAAFDGLAPSRWLISDEAARREVLPAYFRICLDHALASGVICTTPDRDAAALWLPAGQPGHGQLPDYPERLRAATIPWTRRILAFDAALASRHPAGPPHPHLASLAVRPDRQGRGTGTALLESYHQVLDQAGAPAYLEASDERTRRLYLRHGYTALGQPLHLPDGPPLHPMWREPRPWPRQAAAGGGLAGS